MTEDEKLLHLFQVRDEQAAVLAEQHYGKLCQTIAYRILGDSQDAEECANDVLLKLWNSIPPAEPRSLTAFVSGITRNLALDRLSARQAAKRGGTQLDAALDDIAPYLVSADDTESIVETVALQEALTSFLRVLPKDSRMIFLARYYSMQTVKEIAEEHGATVGQVKMNLKRTKEKLKVFLEKEGLL